MREGLVSGEDLERVFCEAAPSFDVRVAHHTRFVLEQVAFIDGLLSTDLIKIGLDRLRKGSDFV